MPKLFIQILMSRIRRKDFNHQVRRALTPLFVQLLPVADHHDVRLDHGIDVVILFLAVWQPDVKWIAIYPDFGDAKKGAKLKKESSKGI